MHCFIDICRKRKISDILFLIGWLLKPIYLQKSGNAQIGDILMLLGMILCFVESRKVLVDHRDRWMVMFVASVGLINSFYFLRWSEPVFLKPILWFFYNLLLVLFLRQKIMDESFRRALSFVSLTNILIQVMVFVIGQGRYFLDEQRYMGTYNDPNALAYAMLAYSVIIFLVLNRKKRFCLVLSIVSGAMIIFSKSITMLLAWGLFFIYLICLYALHYKMDLKILIGLGILVFLIAGIVFFVTGHNIRTGEIVEFSLYDRITKKLFPVNELFGRYIYDRNLQAAAENPRYFLIGAGEGLFSRFVENPNELHNTWISILFCYGLIPFLFLLRWIQLNLAGVNKEVIAVVLIMCLEAWFLVNYRQPMFWLIFMLPGYVNWLSTDEDSASDISLRNEECICTKIDRQ